MDEFIGLEYLLSQSIPNFSTREQYDADNLQNEERQGESEDNTETGGEEDQGQGLDDGYSSDTDDKTHPDSRSTLEQP